MTTEVTWHGDTFSVAMDVRRENGALLDLTDAIVEMSVWSEGTTIDADSVIVTDPASGRAVGVFNPGTLPEQTWNLQARVTLGGIVQTVHESRLTVRRSNFT